MLIKYGKRTRKVPLPVVVHLNQAVGPLRLHTGRNPQGIKNARSIKWRAISPDSNVRHCKYRVFLKKNIDKGCFFQVRLIIIIDG